MGSPHFGRDASNRHFFDCSRITSDAYTAVCCELTREFGIIPVEQVIVGLDQQFQEYRQGDRRVLLRWDNWMGFMAIAIDPSSDRLVDGIGAFVLGRFARRGV